MKNGDAYKAGLILSLFGIIPVVWLALLTAPYVSGGIVEIIENLSVAVENPFSITVCGDTPRIILIFLLAYGMGIGVYFSTRRNYRKGEEHGSAKWGNAGTLNKKYRDKDASENKLLTQSVRIGLDGKKHRRNLNILVVGGSGAGKTRFFCKPNVMQCNTSMVILDPKGEIVRDTGGLLEKKGYEVRVLDLINMHKSHCYNPFVYLRNDNDVQRLVTNLFKATTPKGSQSQDPFWDTAASMLLLSLVFYLKYEAPPDEQNFPMVMELLRAGEVREDDDGYVSPLDELFDRLEMVNPEHIALKYYRDYHSGSAKTLKSIQITLAARLEKFNLNGNSFILGVSGAGKSFTAKEEMTNIILTDPNVDVIVIDPEREYSPLVKAMQGEVVHISATSDNHINAMDMNSDYGDGANPVILKSEFILSLCEQLIGGASLGAKQKSIIDRCTAGVYRYYQQGNYMGTPPTLQDFREELLKQDEPEAQEIALAIELFTDGSLNTFAKHTNVDTHSRLICYDILDLGKQLQPIGMLVVLDSILNRITQNRAKGRNTFIFIDEIYLLFQHEYSANFLFTLWKRVRKYGAYCTGITQNVDDLLQSHTARTMLANSEFIIMLNQASTDRIELAKLLNISDLQMSYITNVGAGQGLLKVGSSLVPFVNKFPRNTKLYKLMTTKFGEC